MPADRKNCQKTKPHAAPTFFAEKPSRNCDVNWRSFTHCQIERGSMSEMGSQSWQMLHFSTVRRVSPRNAHGVVGDWTRRQKLPPRFALVVDVHSIPQGPPMPRVMRRERPLPPATPRKCLWKKSCLSKPEISMASSDPSTSIGLAAKIRGFGIESKDCSLPRRESTACSIFRKRRALHALAMDRPLPAG